MKLESSFKTFFRCHQKLIDHYKISVRRWCRICSNFCNHNDVLFSSSLTTKVTLITRFAQTTRWVHMWFGICLFSQRNSSYLFGRVFFFFVALLLILFVDRTRIWWLTFQIWYVWWVSSCSFTNIDLLKMLTTILISVENTI